MKTPEQITQWLKDRSLYGRFAANYNRSARHKASLAAYIKKAAPADLLACAFVWHDTPEGNRHWFNINNDFIKWLNDH